MQILCFTSNILTLAPKGCVYPQSDSDCYAINKIKHSKIEQGKNEIKQKSPYDLPITRRISEELIVLTYTRWLHPSVLS